MPTSHAASPSPPKLTGLAQRLRRFGAPQTRAAPKGRRAPSTARSLATPSLGGEGERLVSRVYPRFGRPFFGEHDEKKAV